MVKSSSKQGSNPKAAEWALNIYEAVKSNLSHYQVRTINRVIVSGKRCDGITSDQKSKRGGGTTSDQKSNKSISKKDVTILKQDMIRLNTITNEAYTILKKYK